MGRLAAGVKGVTLAHQDDRVVGMVAIYQPNADLLVVSEKGIGKRSAVADYRITKRSGKGVKTLHITPKTGALAAIKAVTDTDELLIINKSGTAIRIPVSELRVMGRNTQGVRLIRLNGEDEVASVAKIEEKLWVMGYALALCQFLLQKQYSYYGRWRFHSAEAGYMVSIASHQPVTGLACIDRIPLVA